MRHADKSSLAKALLEKVMNSEIEIDQSDILSYYVLDGGALLHRVFLAYRNIYGHRPAIPNLR